MHASYLIHSGILAGLMVAFLWFTGRRNDAFWAAGLYAALVLPLVVYIATQLTDPYTSAANQLLAIERVPHHTQPDRWWDTTDAFHVGVIGLAAALIWWKDRGFSRIAVLATTFYVGIGVAAVVLTNNPNLAILMPWRASGYLYTIAQLAVLTAGLLFLIKVLERWPRFATSLVIFVPLVLLLWGTVENGLFSVLESEYADTTTQPQYPFMLQIQQNTPENAVLLTPLRDGDYRLGAQRAVYVDWKSHPYKGTQVLDWWERVEFIREFYTLDAPERQQACRDAGADFYVLGAENLGEPEQPAISWETLALVPCPLP